MIFPVLLNNNDGLKLKQHSLTILSLNAGLLIYDLIRIPFFTPVPYLKERLLCLPSEILKEDADIIFLQEVYHIKHKKFLERSLKKTYPYFFYIHKGHKISMENGLVIFSKYLLNETSFVPFQQMRFEEKLFSKMGYLRTSISFSQLPLVFYNVHFTAGGLLGPEHKQAEALRAKQINQLMQDLKKYSDERSVIAGDFNCGPDVSSANYEALIKEGFINLNTKLLTWDPLNPLNRNGIHKDCPPQSIDHVFLNKKDFFGLKSYEAWRVFDKPVVKTKQELLTLSDHYGLKVRLQFH